MFFPKLRQTPFIIYEDDDASTCRDNFKTDCDSSDFASIVHRLSKDPLCDARAALTASSSLGDAHVHFPDGDGVRLENLANVFLVQQTYERPSFKLSVRSDLESTSQRIELQCFFHVMNDAITVVNRGGHGIHIAYQECQGEKTQYIRADGECQIDHQSFRVLLDPISINLHIFPRGWRNTEDTTLVCSEIQHKRRKIERSSGDSSRLLSLTEITTWDTPRTFCIRPKRRPLGLLAKDAESYDLTVLPNVLHQDSRVSLRQAKHSELGDVVVKSFLPQHQSSVREAAQSFIRDIKLSKQAVHPFILSPKAYDARLLTILTARHELTLLHDIDKGRFFSRPEDFARICFNMACALRFLHNVNKTKHRNINPGAIALVGRQYVLTGFQFGAELQNSEKYNQGCIDHTPPEFHTSKNALCESADMWSLGIVLLYIQGSIRLPIGYENGERWRNNLLSDECRDESYTWHKEIRIKVNELTRKPEHDIIVRLLQRDPKKRLSSRALFKTASLAFPQQASQWNRFRERNKLLAF